MSAISSVCSSTIRYQVASQSSFGQFAQSFQAIGGALQSGDLSTAQSALATFQQNLTGNSQSSNSSTNQPFGNNSQANTDYQNLVSSLQSNNVSGAQQAFSSLQSDLKTHKGHHHHHHSSSTTSSTTTTSASNAIPDSDSTSDTSTSLNVTA